MNNKRLYRIESQKKICGVCAGIAEFLNVDVTIIRLAWIVFSMIGGSGVLVYFLSALVMPVKEDSDDEF